MTLQEIQHFLHTGNFEHLVQYPNYQRKVLGMVQRFYLSIRFFIERGHIDYATQLSFNTIMAIVPLFALIFAIGKGFGLMESLEAWVRETFVAQPQVATTIIDLAKSYLKNTSAGIFLGIGLVFMLYSLLSLVRNVEMAFNAIWQVKHRRSWSTSIASYSALLFLAPITLIVLSGLTLFIYGLMDPLKEYLLLGSVSTFLLSVVLPWVLLTFIFVALYVLMPNTKVQPLQALLPSMLASMLMLFLQGGYVHIQSILTSYSAVYGSLAALPLFMLWMQLSWYICLFCAELCYTNQNLAFYASQDVAERATHTECIQLSALLLGHICQAFSQGKSAPSMTQLQKDTGAPFILVSRLLHRMIQVHLIVAVQQRQNSPTVYLPAQDTDVMTLGLLLHQLEDTSPTEEIEEESASSLSFPLVNEAFSIPRYNYLSALKQVLVRDLVNNKELEN